MKRLGFLAAAALLSPAAAFADFNGAYAGLSFGTTQGDIEVEGDLGDDKFDFNDGTAISVFAGQNVSSGDLVYGYELGYSSVSDMFVPGAFGDDDELEDIFDLRGRLGYAVDDLLVYGALGYSFVNYVEPGVSDYSISGLSVGAGAEFHLDGGFFVGGDYTVRLLEGDADNDDVD
ncbi:MAG: outer membrane beta-barrel protein, partial [Pseudomonadota bacterium]